MKNKQWWNWFFLGFGGLVLGVLLTVMAFRFIPSMQDKIARSTPRSRQMQVWDDFHQSQRQMLEHFDKMFRGDLEDDFFGGRDPFENFKDLQPQDAGIGVGELSQREDDKFVYFDLSVEDINSTSVQSKIENGYLTVSGTVEKKSVDEGVQKTSKIQFNRTFPLPDNVDAKKMEVVSQGHTITFKFPKV